MSKRIDFAKQRRAQGRLTTNTVRELAASIQQVGHELGINVQRILDDASLRQLEQRRLLAERLQESVVPLFITRLSGQPDRIGSCVLVRLQSKFYALTASHVIRDVGSATLLAPAEGKGGKLLPLPTCAAHLNSSSCDGDLDVCVLALPTRELGPFQQRTFLAGIEIDQEDRPDDQSLQSFYFVLGYSASRTQVKFSRTERRIYQQSFHFATQPVDDAEYEQERTLKADHILLDFDHKEIMVKGRRTSPPRLQGVSGGGIFRISRRTSCGTLVAIATQNRRNSRIIVGTRIKHFLALVRKL